MNVLEVSGLTKRYGTHDAVQNISFRVGAGEIVGLLGPNGAGKTTTISMVLGVLEPSEGFIQIAGTDVNKLRSQALAKTNFAAVYAPLPGNLTVLQNLNVFGRIYDVKGLRARVEELIEVFPSPTF